MRILMIDDEPGATETMCVYLEKAYCRVDILNYVTDSGHLGEALEQFQPEGVVLDYDMVPKGFVLYGWIREWSESVPIVFYTKYADSPWHRDKMLDVGAAEDQIIAKVETANDVPRILRALKRS